MKKLLSFTVSLAVVALTTIVAYASIPDSNGVIHACYKPSDGKLFVIDTSTTSCPSGTVELTWNQTGPQGPAGPTGATGPQGPAGVISFGTYTNIYGNQLTNNTFTSVASVSINLPQSEVVQIEFSSEPNTRIGHTFALLVDGVAIDNPAFDNSIEAGSFSGLYSFSYSVSLTSGNHTIEVDAFPVCTGCGFTENLTAISLTVIGL